MKSIRTARCQTWLEIGAARLIWKQRLRSNNSDGQKRRSDWLQNNFNFVYIFYKSCFIYDIFIKEYVDLIPMK